MSHILVNVVVDSRAVAEHRRPTFSIALGSLGTLGARAVNDSALLWQAEAPTPELAAQAQEAEQILAWRQRMQLLCSKL